ncbi:hypothetical protein [Sphingobacterium spiritivorum]|uniref:hypothetical protein n=1 Tax=Sphingobacterium spiritivorum TaxID=258 RepID=UPI00191898A9|nr:hypothetical protein [Sphingobacterium spiritivorum]QQT25041.1 hypothetical protein I6J02_15090 [Sphingobacterium spiritivorum]
MNNTADNLNSFQAETEFQEETIRVINFLNEIGIPVLEQKNKQESFLPGIYIDKGRLLIDRTKLLHPGDILHEAGHIAVMSAEERRLSSGDLFEHIDKNALEGYELSAIAWSYAACAFLNLPASFVFHDKGYKGDADMLIENFEQGNYLFTPLLQYYGLCYEIKNAVLHQVAPYPHMLKWIRE